MQHAVDTTRCDACTCGNKKMCACSIYEWNMLQQDLHVMLIARQPVTVAWARLDCTRVPQASSACKGAVALLCEQLSLCPLLDQCHTAQPHTYDLSCTNSYLYNCSTLPAKPNQHTQQGPAAGITTGQLGTAQRQEASLRQHNIIHS